MFSTQDFAAMAEDISFRDWRLLVREEPMGQGCYLQWEFDAPDSTKPELTMRPTFHIQHGRKWRLSAHMTKSEFVQTALAAALMAVEHEAREEFHYRGHAVFGPHLDVDALVDAKTVERARRAGDEDETRRVRAAAGAVQDGSIS